ncbi:MAG: PP2C family protein-serine/threonine phosphatase [Candidatus Acidiferrum sp.]
MLFATLLASQAELGDFSIAQWRWAILFMGVAAILLAIGVNAVKLFFYRKQTADRTPLYLGIFVLLYGVRVFLRQAPLLSVFDIPPGVANHIVSTITFTISLPLLLLFLEIVPTRLRLALKWALAIQLIFALFAILSDIAGVARRAAFVANNLLVLASWALLVVILFVLRPPGRLPRELRVVAAGFTVLGVFVVHANLSSLHVLPGPDVEPLGVLFFVGTLGYLVAQRIFSREENLAAIQKELQIAQQIQTSILPHEVPRIPGLDLAACYLPMSAVAGDFYDFLTLEGNQLGVLVADVTGHGVPAALIASMLKVAFAAQKAHAQHPERVLAGLNQAVCGKFEEHFVTAVYVYFDLESKIIRYAGAGHPPVLYSSRASGAARSIEQNGFFLGMFPDAAYSTMELPLQAGDRYLLYTDGLTECSNAAGEEFGIARCKQFLEAHLHLAPKELADALLNEVKRWSARSSGCAQEDDITLVVLECRLPS